MDLFQQFDFFIMPNMPGDSTDFFWRQLDFIKRRGKTSKQIDLQKNPSTFTSFFAIKFFIF